MASRDVGFGFRPGFAGFVDQPGIELELAFADKRGGAPQHRDARGGGRGAPLREEGVGVLNRSIGKVLGGFVMNANHFVGVRRIQRLEQIARLMAFAANQDGIFAAELGAHLSQGALHRLAVFRDGEIYCGFVLKGG